MSLTQISENKCFNGMQRIYSHLSEKLDCRMQFSIFIPPQIATVKCPVVFWLSGLTCTEENFTVKASVQKYAAENGLMVVAPDTSPRGKNVPDHDNYDFGQGASFYLNATEQPWAKNYNMYDYVSSELPTLIHANFPTIPEFQSIMGHSMGGHGALTIGLKNPNAFRAISAFAPIVAPTQCPWGKNSFSRYLGSDENLWKNYDATSLIEAGYRSNGPILIDQGTKDVFLEDQLKPHLFQNACEKAGQPLELRMQPGYDHSYFFITSFIGDHISHHANYLLQRQS